MHIICIYIFSICVYAAYICYKYMQDICCECIPDGYTFTNCYVVHTHGTAYVHTVLLTYI